MSVILSKHEMKRGLCVLGTELYKHLVQHAGIALTYAPHFSFPPIHVPNATKNSRKAIWGDYHYC